MQQRDNKPDISSPGKITAFGGAIENGETPLEAVVREIHEETNLRPQASEFSFYKTYRKQRKVHGDDDTVHYFVLEDVDPKSLEIYEGQGFVEVSSANIEAWDFSVLAGQVAREFLGL